MYKLIKYTYFSKHLKKRMTFEEKKTQWKIIVGFLFFN